VACPKPKKRPKHEPAGLAYPKPERSQKDEEFRAWIRTLPCLLWTQDPPRCYGFLKVSNKRYVTEAAHIRPRRYVDDAEHLIPLCHRHHRQFDQDKGHKTFQREHGINVTRIAKQLWRTYMLERVK
jgi:hypothetical protein